MRSDRNQGQREFERNFFKESQRSSIASPFEEGLNMMFSQVDPRRSVATPVVLCSNAAS
jgi:hypothetical protein